MAKKAAFKVGDRVSWSHDFAIYAPATVLVADAAGEAPRGVIAAVANDEGTWFDVKFDDGDTRTLTGDELVRVEEVAS